MKAVCILSIFAAALLNVSQAGAQTVQLAQGKSCPASEPDGQGASPLENSFRASVRKSFERPPAPGADGKVTVTIQSVKIGNKREWATPDIATFVGDQSKPIYDAIIAFTTCTDYRALINVVTRERQFTCFTDQFNEMKCQVTTATPTPDTNQSFPK